TAREQRAEAAEAREAYFHADVGDRVLAAREQLLRELDAGADSKLVRRFPEYRLELTDEVKRRDAHLAGELLDRRRRFGHVAPPIAGAAQAGNHGVSEQHGL